MRDKKVRGLRIDLARRSTSNGGKYQIDAKTVKRDIFDGKLSDGHVHDLMHRAAKEDGFDITQRQGTDQLLVNLAEVDQEILDAVNAAGSGGHSGQDGSRAGTDGSSPPSSTGQPWARR